MGNDAIFFWQRLVCTSMNYVMFFLYMIPGPILITLFRYKFTANVDDDKSAQSVGQVDRRHDMLT